jgi:hypothetical protein
MAIRMAAMPMRRPPAARPRKDGRIFWFLLTYRNLFIQSYVETVFCNKVCQGAVADSGGALGANGPNIVELGAGRGHQEATGKAARR